jgi:glycine hydroxymethyltransferase
LGTPACTTRGFGLEEWRSVGNLIGDVFDGVKADGSLDEVVLQRVKQQVRQLTNAYPIYSRLVG